MTFPGKCRGYGDPVTNLQRAVRRWCTNGRPRCESSGAQNKHPPKGRRVEGRPETYTERRSAEEAWESDGPNMSCEGGERVWQPGPSGAKGSQCRVRASREKHVRKRRLGEHMSPKLSKVAERAKRDPNARFNSLAHLIDEAALKRAFRRIRKGAAAGVDGITKEDYEQNLEDNLRDLLERMKSKRYRHQPIRRVHIPKAPGKNAADRSLLYRGQNRTGGVGRGARRHL